MTEMEARREIAEALEHGEQLIWAGIPRQGVVFRRSDIAGVPFSLVWAGLVFFWEYTVITMGAPVSLVASGVPFVLVGLYLLAGRHWIDTRRRARTAYGVTSRRIVIIAGLRSRRTTSLPLRSLPEVILEERRNRSGNIIFWPKHVA